ncbi:protein terminal ear1-like [Neltuma alba]|uniref:protein terminal ear1-like n=1 Tax=Neltuma alba TaxID=207710 RepID=UPI0010A44C17|nr:protein terminal ear1-like [Prosopis alba]
MEECDHARATTVMIKNVPYHFQFKDLISILDEHCFQQNQSSQRASSLSMYDFVYLPMDYKKFAYENKQSNLGYAFVNFTTARAAFLFFKRFNQRKWPGHENWKFCEVAKAQIQDAVAVVQSLSDVSTVSLALKQAFMESGLSEVISGMNDTGTRLRG